MHKTSEQRTTKTNNNSSRQWTGWSQQQKHYNKKWNVFKVNNKEAKNDVNGLFIFNFIVNFTYSGVFIVNFQHISHLARREKYQNPCFILKKKIMFNKLQFEVFFLPNISPRLPECRPIKYVLCPYIRPGCINGILRYSFTRA